MTRTSSAVRYIQMAKLPDGALLVGSSGSGVVDDRGSITTAVAVRLAA